MRGLMVLALAMAASVSATSPVGAALALQPGNPASDKQAMLMIVCRVWAKANVEVLETDVPYWRNYYEKSYAKLIAMGYDARNIATVQESRAKAMHSDMRDGIAMYLDLLGYKLDAQAAEYRAKTFGTIDKECRASMS